MIRMPRAWRTRRSGRGAPAVDDRPTIELDLDADTDVALIAFGGLAGNIGMPPFEFFRLAGDLSVKKIFLRDLRQAWYHFGLSDDAPSFEGMVEHLAGLVDRAGATRVVCFGNSLGGYAALAAGRMLGADEVHAFSPQTFLSAELRRRHGDDRWAEHVARVQGRRPPVADELLDLARLFAKPVVASGATHLHFGAAYPLDTAHAERLEGAAGVTLHAYDDADHDLVRRLRDQGELARILAGALR
jgi:hypothetical protein